MSAFFNQIAVPARGDYKKASEVKAAWARGDDFLAEPLGRYMSIRDVPKGMKVQARYDRLQKITILEA